MPDLFEINIDKQEKEIKENIIPSPSSLWCVVKKTHEAKFMRIAVFVCKYLCRMSYDKVEHARIFRLVKEIDFWYVGRVQ